MDSREIHKYLEIICRPKHDSIEKKLEDHEERLNCNDKKITYKADRVDLDKKADKGEVENLEKWVSKIDGRFWGAIIASLFASLSALGALLLIILKHY